MASTLKVDFIEPESAAFVTISSGTGALTTTKLSISTAVGKIIPGATSLSHRNNADSADNLLISDAGIVSTRNLLDLSNAAAGQIKFPAAQNASANANTLDDYEEGTWSPASSGTATYSFQIGTYTKIGRVVIVTGFLEILLIGTGDPQQLAGFPFASSGAFANYPMTIADSQSIATAVVSLDGRVNAASTGMTFMTRIAASTSDAVRNVLANGSKLSFSGAYIT